MFRILLIIGLLFASATQGFARKVDVAFADTLAHAASNAVISELGAPECCEAERVLQTKSTYCKPDCKGVIGSSLDVPHNAAQAPDRTTQTRRSSLSGHLEPGPPKA